MSTTVTSSNKREAEAGVAEETNNSKKEEQIRDVNEDEEFIKEFLTKDIVALETVILGIERVPMFCLLFFSLFPRCFGIAAQILSATNLIHAVLFIGRLMLCPSAIGFDFLFFSERIAFLLTALVHYFEYSRYWEVGAAIFVVTNMIRIALLTHNWSSIKAQIRQRYCFLSEDMSNREESAEAESEDEYEVEADEPPKKKQVILKEADSELCEESQKTNEIGSEDLETRDDEKKDELMIGNQEEQAKDEDKSKSHVEEEDNHNGFLRHKKFLGDLNPEAHCLQLQKENNELTLNLYAATETLEHYRRIEKSFAKCDEEKKDLAAKLDDAVEKLRHYQQEKKDLAAKLDDAVEKLTLYQQEKDDLAAKLDDTVETLRHCQRGKKDLALNLDDNVETLRHYQRLVQDYHFNDHRKWEKEKQNLLSEVDAFNLSPLQSAANPASDQYNPPSSNAAAVQNVSNAANAPNYQSDVDGTHTSPLMFPRGLASADAQYSGDCERIHGAILEAKPFSWELERNDLIAKLTATSAWYQYYVHAAYDCQLQNHNLLVERNDLSAKLQSASTSAEFYKACLDDSDDECRKLREENNSLSAKLFAETASAEHYHKLVNEMEEKCRKLKEEKNELIPKLYAAKAASQLYRSYLHDAGSLGV